VHERAVRLSSDVDDIGGLASIGWGLSLTAVAAGSLIASALALRTAGR
jgi:hypothetical protein